MSSIRYVEDVDCPLCLSILDTADHDHPLQCPSQHCQFNCCNDCLERMIKATKGGRSEASDGNAFRVFLHCPNCRGNLGPSIRDTILLRKVDKYREFHRQYTPDGVEVIDEKLSASELRCKYALEKDEDVASAIQLAQGREDEFFGRNIQEREESIDASSRSFRDDYLLQRGPSLSRNLSSYLLAKSAWSFDDKEGLEADLQGSKISFEDDELRKFDNVRADTTLLCGLDAFMTEQEQQFMTAQLISGETARLAVATELMYYVAALSREGIKPSLKRQQSGLTRNLSMRRCRMLESIKEVIREGNEARRLEEEREAAQKAGRLAPSSRLHTSTQRNVNPGGRARGKRQKKRIADLQIQQEVNYMKLHPLPLRMPKYAEVTVTTHHPLDVSFVDDLWDGTILDAFSKITVSTGLLGHVTVTKQSYTESDGVRKIINASLCSPNSPKKPIKSRKQLARPRSISTRAVSAGSNAPKSRVIIASINRELGRQGVVAGDVLTHFNGDEFTGSAADVMEMIKDQWYEGEVMTFVFNADTAVAEALRRRSMISHN